MFFKAIPEAVANILTEIHLMPIPEDSYLAGGTGVAIYLGHRVSVDIDLFTQSSFSTEPLLSFLKKRFDTEIKHFSEKDSLIVNINNVRFSLFHYPYPLIEKLTYVPEFKINLASPYDIVAMKVVAIVQRGTAKDFIDLMALISRFNISFAQLIETIIKKYGVSMEYSYQVKKALLYFDDARKGIGEITLIDNGKMRKIREDEWEKVEEFFKKLIIKET